MTAWSISHYDYAIDFRTREATATLTVEASGSGHCIVIPFAPEDVDRVTIDGERAHVTLDDGVMSACGRMLDAETVALVARLVVPDEKLSLSDVGFSTFEDIDGNDVTYLLSWVDECDRHGPCDSSPSAFATYRFSIAHDPAQQVLCPGTISTPEPDLTVCDFTHAGGPTYSTFGAIAGQWTETSLGSWGGVDVALFDLPATGIAAALQTSSLEAFVIWMEGTFGEYPYGSELRLVTANTYWSGFEHPGNIVLSDGLATAQSSYLDPLTHVTLHEISHQWAGDETTLASTYDFVWKEAMAEYLSFVFEDENLAPGTAQTTAGAWKNWAAGAAHPLVPDYSPELFEYYGEVYGPGPMVLFRQMEGMFGRAAVISALQELLGSPRAISVADVRDALETTTGASLDGYFDAWVYGSEAPAWPEATIGVTDAGAGDVELAVSLSTADAVPRGCAFTVTLVGTSGNAYDVPLDFGPDGGAIAPQTVTPGFDVTGTLLDPYYECLVFPAGSTFSATRRDPWRAR